MREFRLRATPLHLLIRTTSNKDYYITDRGNIIGIDVKTIGEKRRKQLDSCSTRKHRLKPTSKYPGQIKTVRIGKEDLIVKVEVVKAFTNCKIVESYQIQHKDGNAANCALNNLVVYDLDEAEQFKKMGKLIVFYKNGVVKTFGSHQECADALYVSRRALNNYMKNRTSKSVISDQVAKIEIIGKEVTL